MTSTISHLEIPVGAEEALRDALGFGVHLWEAHTIAQKLLAAGYVIRRVETYPATTDDMASER